MKRFLFLLLSFFLIYVAGMYRYPALMALGVGQVLLLLFLVVQNRICGCRMRAAFERESITAVKGEPAACGLSVQCGGKLPLGGMGFQIQYGYGEKKRRKRLYGNGESVAFRIQPAYCGVVLLHLETLWVYDYLSLGRAKKKTSQNMRVTVFPREKALDIRFQEKECGNESEENRLGAAPLSENGDVRQVREYRKDDSFRHLHWKLSARAGQLLVKEQEQEKMRQAVLCLNLEGYGQSEPQDKDKFYELLSSVVLGLLRERDEILVKWQGGDLKISSMAITQAPQCKELLSKLYLMKAPGGFPGNTDTDIVLDIGLRLSQGGRELYQFSGERLTEEIGRVRILAEG